MSESRQRQADPDDGIASGVDDADACIDSMGLTTSESALEDSARLQAQDAMIDRLQDADDSNNPHAFVVMPFGIKPAPNGKDINFDQVYELMIKPSLIEAGFQPFRADEESVSGDILTDMFQELLLADLVVADMSIDNANVFYELGVRHAFRKRGVVHIQSGRDYMPFDVFNVRTLPYHVDDNGVPDPEHLDRDKKNLIRITSETWASDVDAVHSPIFGLLTGLSEPDRQSLRTPLATNFWREFNDWEERIAIARRQKRIGDILLLTEEISNPLCKEDAVYQAGLALRELGRHELALQEYRKGLAVNPRNVEFRREEAVILSRMGRVDEAIIKLERLLEDEPGDTDATCCLGRIYTSIWKDCWAHIENLSERRKAAFDAYQWMIKSIDTYLKGFHVDLNIHEPGIKAFNMCNILLQLAAAYESSDEPDSDIATIRALQSELSGTLGLSLKARAASNMPDYWTLASLGEWHLIRGDGISQVSRMYRKSLSYARKNVFHLRSSLNQIDLFLDLELFVDAATVAHDILSKEILRIEAGHRNHENSELPLPQSDVLSFLFAGHHLDNDPATIGRFPAELENEVRRQIDASLDEGNADWNDHGFVAGAACGGDIIFIEACLDKGMKVHVHMPCSDADFVSEFVSYGGEHWIKRFYSIRNNPRVNLYYQSERVGEAKEGIDIFERNTRWTLYASLVLGIDKLRFIALWDGKAATAEDEDGRLLSGMISHARKLGCIIDHLNITKLEYLFNMNTQVCRRDSNATLRMDERVELLSQVSLFSSLHNVDLTQIALIAEERLYTHGKALTLQNEQADELFIVARGNVIVSVASADGASNQVAIRGAGEYVGEMAIFRDEMRMASLLAEGDVLVLVINQRNFRKILRDRPECSLVVTRTLAERLKEATQQLESVESTAQAKPVLEDSLS